MNADTLIKTQSPKEESAARKPATKPAPAATPKPARTAVNRKKPGVFKPKAEANGAPAPRFYYDKASGKYWRENPHGEFIITDETNLKRHFKMAGLPVDLFEPNGLKSFEVSLVHAQNDGAVDHVIALSGHKAGVFETTDGRKILVPRPPRLPVPKPGDWKNFEALHAEMFGGKQLPFVLGWEKVMLEDLRSFNPSAWRHHQMLALVGPPDCGKSFFQFLITLLAGRRETDPYLWMVDKSNFNEDLAECSHLKMEDKQAFRDVKSRAAFAAKIKQLTVSSETPIHGKTKKQFSAPCFRRLTISLNDDSDYITVLPMLDDSIMDKMTLLKCSPATMLPDFAENRARFVRELPAFVHYLLNGFEIPENLQSKRFGVASYLNPEVVEMLQQFEPHLRFREILDATFFPNGKGETIRATATEIATRLTEGAHGRIASQLLSYSSACGQLLSRLEKGQPSRFVKVRTGGARRWTIQPPSE